MKKTPLLIFCALLLCGSLHAKPVDANKARQVASAFLNRVNANEGKPFALTDITSQTPYTEFYVFTLGETGFILVSADDVAIPILGYSTTSRFVTKDMPENVAAWYEDYEREIRTLKEVLGSDNEPAPGWEIMENPTDLPRIDYAVTPLITTTWNQSSPYNQNCPMIGSIRAPTGCVATATAQLMKFWNHPATGHGSHSYNHSSAGELSADFGATTYDWDNMPVSLTASSSNTQKTAVATLMYHIGVAVQMNYGSSSSGATTLNYPGRFSTSAQTALMKYFKYKSSMTSIRLENYTSDQWRALLRAELDASRPVLYSGRNTDGGHAFICDGYNNSNQFHFNWGWGGSHDGNFAIGSLNPGVGGIGGNASGTYNMDNAALIGVEPHSGTFGVGGTVSVSTTGCGGCSVSGAGTYNFGDTVTLLPAATECYRFARWENGCNVGPRIFTPNGGDYNFTAQFERLDGDTLSYCGNQSQASAYRTSSSSSYWGIRLPASLLYNGTELQAVQLYVAEAGAHTFNAYTSNPTTSTPAATATDTFATSQVDSWQTITLSTPLALNGTQDLWLTFEYSADPNAFPAAVCPSTGNSDGLLMYPSFIPRLDASRPYTFMIRGIFYRPPIPIVYDTATVPYYTGFEGSEDRGWEFVNNEPNKWYIGSTGGSTELFISNNGGAANAYTNNQTCVSFATRTFNLAAGHYNLDFAWKCNGESSFDFMRVFICPASSTPEASFFSTDALARTGVPTGWMGITGNYLNRRSGWSDTSYSFDLANAGLYKLVFMWRNDHSQGSGAAAVDNISLERIVLPATLPYSTGFETADDCDWEYSNAAVNQWHIGTAVSQSGTRALYISNDGGSSNVYTSSAATSQSMAYRSVTLAAGEYDLNFNWRCYGEGDYDFMRVFLCPDSENLANVSFSGSESAMTTTPTGWLDLSNGKLNQQTSWQSASYTFQVAAAGDYKLVFLWYNDNSVGSNPPAAIDNVQLAVHSNTYNVTLSSGGYGTVSPAGTSVVDANGSFTATATPANGYHFTAWKELPAQTQVSTDNPYTFSVTRNISLAAYFAVNNYTVTATSANTTMGSVSGGGSYDHGSTATLTATAATGYHFVEWQDGNQLNPRGVIVTGDSAFTATFAPNSYWITAISNNYTMGTVSGGNTMYDYNSTATLTATAVTGYHFVEWQDGITDNPRTITVTGEATYTATFEADAPIVNYHNVSAASADATRGSVSSTHSGSVEEGTSVTVTATAATGHSFTAWKEGSTQVSSNAAYTFTVTRDISLTAHFAVNSYTVTATSADNSMGSVTGGGSYEYNSAATLTATANNGYHFVQWQDGNTQNPLTVTVTGDATYTATFAPNSYTLTVNANDNAMGSVSGGGSYDYNATATLTATPNSGYHFVQWQDGITDNPRTVTVTANATYTATFEANAPIVNYHSVSVSTADATMGSVSSTHSGSVEENTQVTVTATPATGHHFVQWQYGAGQTSTANPYTFTLTGDITLNALFAADTYTLTATSSSNTMGSVSGGGEYTYGATATLYATPNSGYHFVQWQDGNTDNPRIVTVTANATYTATFEANAPDVTYYNVTVIADGSDMGTVSSTHSGSVAEGTQITVTASPAAGYLFAYWMDETGSQLSAANPYTFTLIRNITVVAAFHPMPTPQCDVPTNVTVSDITPTSATIDWNPGSNEQMWEIDCNGTRYNSSAHPFLLNELREQTTYTVKVRARCDSDTYSDWSEPITFTTPEQVGIDEVASGTIALHPNPATTEATLTGLVSGAKVEVLDLQGRLQATAHAVHATLTIDVSLLPRGTYFVRVTTEHAATVRKLIVQ